MHFLVHSQEMNFGTLSGVISVSAPKSVTVTDYTPRPNGSRDWAWSVFASSDHSSKDGRVYAAPIVRVVKAECLARARTRLS